MTLKVLTLFRSTKNVNGKTNYQTIRPIRSITSKKFKKGFYEQLDTVANKMFY